MAAPNRKSIIHAILDRHWNGNVPLYQAFWVAIVAYGVIWHALWFGVYLLLGNYSFNPLASAIGAAAYWCLFVGFYSWQCIGTWHAADKFNSKNNRPEIAFGAKVCTAVFAILMTAEASYIAADTVFRNVRLANAYLTNPAIQLQVSEDATQLTISGQIGYDTAGNLSRLLEKNPTIKYVNLNSSGGSFDQAIKMRDMIRKRNLETFVVGECTFSCTHVYLGGLLRHYDPSVGKLGFHAPLLLSAVSEDNSEAEDEAIRAAISYRVNEAFAEEAYRYKGETSWFPSREVLFAADVIND